MTVLLPRHELPKINKKSKYISFENAHEIEKVYKDILGLKNISHMSINVVNKNGEMSVISANPNILFNICNDGTFIYNGSISSSFYNFRDIYSWDETYDERFYQILKNNMERKNGIKKGVVIVKREQDQTTLYSFATNKDGKDFFSDIKENTKDFFEFGDYCVSRLSELYIRYGLKNTQPRVDLQNLRRNIGASNSAKIFFLSSYKNE